MYGNTNSGPSLDLQFAKYKSLEDYVTGKNLITFTRASTGTYVDSNGIIQTAAVDTPRFDHDPVTGESLGLLIEESRTNLLTYSEEVDQIAWAKAGTVSVVPNSALSPDGLMTADQITLGTQNARVGQFNLITTTGQAGTASVYLKNIDHVGALTLRTGLSGGPTYNLNISLTNEWARYQLTTTHNGTQNVEFHIREVDANPSGSFLMWGAQLEPNASFPTSYIPTTSSTVTRATDLTSITGTNFSSWYNQSEGTAFAEYDGLKDYSRVLNLNTGKTLIVNRPIINSAYDGVTETASEADLGLTLGDTRKSVTAYSGTTTTVTINGRVPVTGSSDFTSTTNTVIYLGGQGNDANVLNGHISRLTYFPERLPDATLQAITS